MKDVRSKLAQCNHGALQDLDRTFVETLRNSWHTAVPGVFTASLAFLAGGYFPVTTGLAVSALCLLLVARVTIAERPFAGWSFSLAVVAGALALFAGWTLISGEWSDSPARALVESDRAVLYLLVVVFMGLHARGPGRLAAVLRWAALAIAIASAVSLLTRLLPTTFPTKAGVNNERLAFPLTYWNAMGMFCALGVLLAAHLTASEREPRGVRIAAAAALPVIAVTLYFTFSRGGIAVAILGFVLYVVLAHSRGMMTALPAAGLPLAVALHEAYGAELLAQHDYAGADARAQGHSLLVVVIACMIAAALLRALTLRVDRRLAAVRIDPRTRTIAFAGAGAAALIALAVATVAFDLPDRFADQKRAFERGNAPPGGRDLRTRLPTVDNNGRLAIWRVALDDAKANPWHGSGAGTFRLVWERDRPAPAIRVTEAHSLYLEVRAELGWIGVVLLAVAFAVPLGVAVARLRGPERHALAAFLAAGVALLGHAMVDWDWEMPALFVWFFGAAGVLVAAPAGASEHSHEPRRLTRLLAGLALLLVAVTPLTVVISQSRLNEGVNALRDGDCRTATNAALGSIDALAVQAEAFEVLGWCDARAGEQRFAVAAMRAAQRRDPDNWHYAYGLAVTQALAGQDPRPAAALARRLNPREQLTIDLDRRLRTNSAARRRAVAARAQIPFE
jgi:O-antigen ligase